jgi:hypothetical protein
VAVAQKKFKNNRKFNNMQAAQQKMAGFRNFGFTSFLAFSWMLTGS